MTGRGLRWFAIGILAGAIQILSALILTTPAAAEEAIQFSSITYRLSQFQRDRAKARGEADAPNTGQTIKGHLFKPEGAGRFPALVLLHGCSGLASGLLKGAEFMRSWGYVVLAPDSFATRNIKDACTPDQTYLARRDDALGALVYLSKLAFVDPTRIAVIGYSQGGIAALTLASSSPRNVFEMPDGLWFKIAVAFYPSCEVVADDLTIPTLIMTGEMDDWALAANCERLARRNTGKGNLLKLSIYPGAYHAFDASAFLEGRRVFGHWLEYDDNAAKRSTSEMREFLARSLRRD